MGINSGTSALNPNFKYCQLGKVEGFLLIPHFAKPALSNSCYCLLKGEKHCIEFLPNSVSTEIILSFSSHILQVNHLKISPISRVNIEAIYLGLYFT